MKRTQRIMQASGVAVHMGKGLTVVRSLSARPQVPQVQNYKNLKGWQNPMSVQKILTEYFKKKYGMAMINIQRGIVSVGSQRF